MQSKLVLFSTMAFVSACASIGQVQSDLDDQLLTRASFDMSCPREQLTITPLTTMYNGVTGSQGVEGCGKKASYVLAGRGEWVLNAVSDAKP